MKPNLPKALLVALIVSSLASSPAAAQTDMTEELRRLNRSVEQLVDLVGQLISQSETDLLLRRTELKQRQAEPLERELRQKTEQRDQSFDYYAIQEEEIERVRSEIFEAEGLDAGSSKEEEEQRLESLRDQLRQSEISFEQFERNYQQIEARISALEGILGPLRAELSTLEQALDERLLP